MLIKGKKNQEFVKFVLVPKNIRSKTNKYILMLGWWDTRQNKKTRFFILNIYKILECYKYGMTTKSKIINFIYNYFIDLTTLKNWEYFRVDQLYLLIEKELKKKFQFKKFSVYRL